MPKTDLTFRIDTNGNMIESKRGDYICNIIQLIFSMVPGTDEYAPDRGLNIMERYRTCYNEGTRDTEYESNITKQLTTYTDLIPVNVIAVYIEKTFFVYMAIRYENTIYEIDLNANSDSLSTLLRNS